jgi:hypothetical protein
MHLMAIKIGKCGAGFMPAISSVAAMSGIKPAPHFPAQPFPSPQFSSPLFFLPPLLITTARELT